MAVSRKKLKTKQCPICGGEINCRKICEECGLGVPDDVGRYQAVSPDMQIIEAQGFSNIPMEVAGAYRQISRSACRITRRLPGAE